MLNPKHNQWLFDKKSHTNNALGQLDQYLVKVKDHNFHTTNRFQEEIKVLEL
jgi:hypothetical protein